MSFLKSIFLSWICLTILFSVAACADKEPSYEDRETFPQETYVALDDTVITFRDGLLKDMYPAQTPVGDWLAGCQAPDRDEQLDAYVLRHEWTSDGHTTFTYLIYYPHGGRAMVVTPSLMEGKSGYVLNLTYTAHEGVRDYSLCYLSVSLPTDQAPRLRLLVDDNPLGVLSTVTQDKIPAGTTP